MNRFLFRSFRQIRAIACSANRQRLHATEQERRHALIRAATFERRFHHADRTAFWNDRHLAS